MTEFAKFKLSKDLLKMLEELGYNQPTPIQDLAIPQVMAGSDVIASAQTGTGKTAAFMLPALQQIKERGKGPRVLVLVPTRELAIQVWTETEKYSKYLKGVRSLCIYGGVPYPKQKRQLSRPHDIIIGTPGRLIDLMNKKMINLANIEILVLDEADRMLDMGFVEPVMKISKSCPKGRQTLLFSATIDRRIANISGKLQNDPFKIDIKPDYSIKGNIDQRLYYVDNIGHKNRLLSHLLNETEIKQSIIFTGTKKQSEILARDLKQKGYSSEALHGDMDQRRRTRTIKRLRQGEIDFLIATDVAARGIDIPSISHVINFDLPYHPEDYVHRIGRTGRAGASGTAITFSTFKEDKFLEKISKITGRSIETYTVTGMEPSPKKSENPKKKRFSGKKGRSFIPSGRHKKPFKARKNRSKSYSR